MNRLSWKTEFGDPYGRISHLQDLCKSKATKTKYTDLSPEEIRLNIIEPLADAMICIAHANADFICTECLRTLEQLKCVLGCLDGEVALETIAEVDEILGEELNA